MTKNDGGPQEASGESATLRSNDGRWSLCLSGLRWSEGGQLLSRVRLEGVVYDLPDNWPASVAVDGVPLSPEMAARTCAFLEGWGSSINGAGQIVDHHPVATVELGIQRLSVSSIFKVDPTCTRAFAEELRSLLATLGG
ncbi:MAG: hypothetical protein AAGB93_06235 [Planctomycetota bacterium]